MENAGIFYGHLKYFMVIWYMLWPFGNVVVIWYIFLRFGTFCVKKNLATLAETIPRYHAARFCPLRIIQLERTLLLFEIWHAAKRWP
jgi:hypothetical protein